MGLLTGHWIIVSTFYLIFISFFFSRLQINTITTKAAAAATTTTSHQPTATTISSTKPASQPTSQPASKGKHKKTQREVMEIINKAKNSHFELLTFCYWVLWFSALVGLVCTITNHQQRVTDQTKPNQCRNKHNRTDWTELRQTEEGRNDCQKVCEQSSTTKRMHEMCNISSLIASQWWVWLAWSSGGVTRRQWDVFGVLFSFCCAVEP